MKLTTAQLKKIVTEELEKSLPRTGEGSKANFYNRKYDNLMKIQKHIDIINDVLWNMNHAEGRVPEGETSEIVKLQDKLQEFEDEIFFLLEEVEEMM